MMCYFFKDGPLAVRKPIRFLFSFGPYALLCRSISMIRDTALPANPTMPFCYASKLQRERPDALSRL